MKIKDEDVKIIMVIQMTDRIKNISKLLSSEEAFIVENASNRFYFTGFNSSAGVLLITNNKAYFLVDFRYYEKAKKTIKHCEVLLANAFLEDISGILQKENINKIYLEISDVSVSTYKRYAEKLSFANLLSDERIEKEVLRLRSVKNEKELQNIKLAQKLTDETFKYILERISKGRTEKEIMLDMEFFIRKQGSEGVAFDFIVVSGKNSSLPHGVPTDKKLEKGDFITMDFGAVVNGYRSDMTRTVALGTVTEEQKKVYETVLSAQLSAIDYIKAGVLCADADKVARDIIDNAGYKGCFGHSLGHSVGIDIHETPNCSPKSKDKLCAGNVITVEPGIYIEDKFGVRIEDMLYVTKNGSINLTASPKDLIIL